MNAKRSIFCPPPKRFSRILFSIFVFCLLCFVRLANAQSADDCLKWAFEVNAAPAMNIQSQLGDGPTSCTDGTNACGTLYYYVSLVRNGDQNGTSSVDFRFLSLNFSGHLSVGTTGGSGTSMTFSSLDAGAAQTCSPDGINDPANSEAPTASWDPDGNFSYSVPYTGSEHTWSVTGRRLLFVIAVHAYPGEVVQPVITAADFQLVTGDAPNTMTEVCGNPTITNEGNLAKNLPALTNCGNSAPKLRLGSAVNANIPGFPNSKRIAVAINGSASLYKIQDLEFLVSIFSTQPMSNISIEPGVLLASDVLLYQQGNSMNQRAHCTAQNIDIAGGSIINQNNTLFTILILGPALNSACANVTVSFAGPRRLQQTVLGSTDCCQPQLSSSNPVSYSVGPLPCTPNCTAAVNIAVKKVATSATNACSDLFFALEITNTGSFGLSYQSGHVVLDLTHDGTLSYVSYAPSAVAFTAPTSVTSTILGPTVLRLDFTFTAATAISLGAGSSKTLATFTLAGSNVCIQSIFFFDATLHVPGASQDCVLQSVTTEIGSVLGDALCVQSFSVRFETEYGAQAGAGIDQVGFEVADDGLTCTSDGTSDASGMAAGCISCAPNLTQTVTPFKKDNLLNGVSTYDLILISRHILGLEALGDPYKMVAADANKARDITTFDIVEIRKLILGIYQDFPNNTSWRFIPKSFTFPNPLNAFQSVFPENFSQVVPPNLGLVRFYGIKIGDVNGSALPNALVGFSVDRDAQILPLGYALPSGRVGELQEIPLFAQQAADIAAWQLALRYDTSQWKIKNVRWAMATEATPYEMADWYSPQAGELRLCWFDRRGLATHLAAQSPIAYLQVERLSNALDPQTALQVMSTIPGEAYAGNGTTSTLALQAVEHYQTPTIIPATKAQAKAEWTVLAYPNPTEGLFRFEINLPLGGEGRIGLYDPMGRLVAEQHTSFTSGLNVVTSQQFPPLVPGMYFVRFDTTLGRQTLRLVKK